MNLAQRFREYANNQFVSQNESDMLEAVADAIERYQPIPVSERLPEAEQQVLLFDAVDGEWLTGMYASGEFVARKGSGLDFGYLPQATHWLPMPPKPE